MGGTECTLRSARRRTHGPRDVGVAGRRQAMKPEGPSARGTRTGRAVRIGTCGRTISSPQALVASETGTVGVLRGAAARHLGRVAIAPSAGYKYWLAMNGLEGLALANKDYVADQYRRWKDDPNSVDESWQLFFAGFELAADGQNGAMQAAYAEAEAP